MRIAFSSDSLVTIRRAVTFSRTRSQTRSPASSARRIFFAEPASAVPVPGKLMPIVSVRQAMVLAV